MFTAFLKAFVMIFLAELGDKTQLAALTATAEAPESKWLIFAGSALALIVTSLLAVLCGDLLSKIPCCGKVVKFVAGGVFILFGIISLVEAFRS